MNETGKNKYSKEFKVPNGFDEVLRNLTREILRHQPKDINKFGKFIKNDLMMFILLLTICFFFAAYDYFTNEIQSRALNGNGQGENY